MSWWRVALREGKTRWLQSRSRRPVRVMLDRPIVSIAFDDVPISTLQNGVPLLESYAIRATFYVCLGLNAESGLTTYLGAKEIDELHRRGHEIGCHTFTHCRLSRDDSATFQADARRNREQLQHVLGHGWPRSFAFPFGQLSFETKKGLAPYYQSLRSNRPGVNFGVADLNCLRAVSLKRGTCDPVQLTRWLNLAERTNGWLIVYSHGVYSQPGPFDIHPETLAWLLDECRHRVLPIMPVWRAAEQVALGSVG